MWDKIERLLTQRAKTTADGKRRAGRQASHHTASTSEGKKGTMAQRVANGQHDRNQRRAENNIDRALTTIFGVHTNKTACIEAFYSGVSKGVGGTKVGTRCDGVEARGEAACVLG